MENEGNDQRQMGLIESIANDREAQCPRAKLVAEREHCGKQKKQPAPEGAG